MYRRYFKEKFDKSDVDKLKRKFSIYLKNIKAITNGKELKIVSISYYEFYQELRYLLKNRITTSSNISTEVNNIDPYYIFKKSDPNENLSDEEWQSFFYYVWETDRNKVYSILQKNSKIILDTLYKVDRDFHIDRGVVHSEVINGVKVDVIGQDLENKDNLNSEVESIRFTKKYLKNAIDMIKKKGLGRVLPGLKIVIDHRITNSKDIDLAGEYHGDNVDTISVYDISSPKTESVLFTIIHEIGHRFEVKILNDKQWEEWDNFVDRVGYKLAPTKYAKVNSKEFFAEVFALYVLGYTRKINDLVLEKFKQIAGLK